MRPEGPEDQIQPAENLTEGADAVPSQGDVDFHGGSVGLSSSALGQCRISSDSVRTFSLLVIFSVWMANKAS